MSVLSIFALFIGAVVARDVAFVNDVTTEIEYGAALRDQGLHRLSELQCRTILAHSQLEEEARAKATIELSKTLVARALNSRPPERETFWQQASAVLDEALGQSPEQPTRVLLQMQQALTALQRAAWSRREAEVRAKDEQGWEAVREQIRLAIKLLKEVEQQLSAPRMRAGDQGLANARVEELLRNTQYQLSRAYRNQAITYPGRSLDRINSLTLAMQQLQPLATSSVVDDVVWQSKIDLVQCYRLLGELEKTRQLIAGATEVPDEFIGRLAAEGIRLALDAKQPDAAMKLVRNSNVQSSHPEFELARIETLVALAQRENEQGQVSQWQQQAAQIASVLGQNHGTYWGLRGEMLIARLADQAGNTGDTSLLDTAAKTFLQRDLPEDATEMFIRAARQAEEQGDRERAFDFRYKAATVDHRQGHLQPAIDRFRDVAWKRYPENTRAPEAHLLAVFDAAALYQQHAHSGQGSLAEQSLDQYRSLLQEHLKRWPDAKSSDQARLWLGRLAAAQRDWDLAIRVYREVKSNSAWAPIAYAQLGALYRKTLHPESNDFLLQLNRARGFFSDRFTVASNPAELIAIGSESARLRLFYDPPDYATAEKQLRRSLPVAETGSAEAQRLKALLVAAMAGNEVAQAQAALSQALPLSAAPLTEILRALQLIRDQRPHDSKLRDLTSDILKLLNTYRDQLSDSDRLLIEQAAADIATVEEAKATYAQLARQHPADSRIQIRYAELLALGRDRQSRLDALAQWRDVVSNSRPRSRSWFRSKLGVAQAHFDMGQLDKAKEIVELTMGLHPELGGSGLQQDYLALLAKCED